MRGQYTILYPVWTHLSSPECRCLGLDAKLLPLLHGFVLLTLSAVFSLSLHATAWTSTMAVWQHPWSTGDDATVIANCCEVELPGAWCRAVQAHSIAGTVLLGAAGVLARVSSDLDFAIYYPVLKTEMAKKCSCTLQWL